MDKKYGYVVVFKGKVPKDKALFSVKIPIEESLLDEAHRRIVESAEKEGVNLKDCCQVLMSEEQYKSLLA